MIKDYEIVKELGKGTYATAYLVSKTISDSTKEYYVIKQINLECMSIKEQDTFKNEANLLSKIKSEFVVKFYESFEENNFYNIVIEYCEGGDLEQLLIERKKIPLNENFIWKVFIQIVIGLGEIHKMNILHRDIKTSNIFLTKNNDVKIGDLGIAKQLIKKRYTNTLIGTPYYLSPEICKEKPYNEKSDIWALGCVLYELCTFGHPFEADNQIALIKKILTSKPKSISNIFDNNFNKILMKLLQKEMNKRPSCQIILKDEYVMKKAKDLKLYKKYQKLIEYNFSQNKQKKSGRINNLFTLENNNKGINTKNRPTSNRSCKNKKNLFNNKHINKQMNNINPFLYGNNDKEKKPIIKNKSKKIIIPNQKEKNIFIDTLDKNINRFKMPENIPMPYYKEVSKIDDDQIKITPVKENNIKKINYRDIFNSKNNSINLSSNQTIQESLNKMLTDFEQYQVEDFINNSPNQSDSKEKNKKNEKNSDIKYYFHIYNNEDIINNIKENNYLSESDEEIESNKKEYDKSENEDENEDEKVTVKILYNIDNNYYKSPLCKKENKGSNSKNNEKFKILYDKENNYYKSNMRSNENQNEIKNEIKKVEISDLNNKDNSNFKNYLNKNSVENNKNLIKKYKKN